MLAPGHSPPRHAPHPPEDISNWTTARIQHELYRHNLNPSRSAAFGAAETPEVRRALERKLQAVLARGPRPYCWERCENSNDDIRPTRRETVGACVHDDFLYVFGGYANGRRLNVMERYSFRDRYWEALTCRGEPPRERSWVSAVAHPGSARVAGASIVIFGGLGESQCFNDAHRFDLATFEWSEIEADGEPPTARSKVDLCVDGDRIYAYGGKNWDETAFNDLHCLDLGASPRPRWTLVETTGDPPQTSEVDGQVHGMLHAGGLVVFARGFVHVLELATRRWRRLVTFGAPPQRRPNGTGIVLHDAALWVFEQAKRERRASHSGEDADAAGASAPRGRGGGLGREPRAASPPVSGGGGDPPYTTFSRLRRLDLLTREWRTIRTQRWPTSRLGATCVVHRGAVYCFGGSVNEAVRRRHAASNPSSPGISNLRGASAAGHANERRRTTIIGRAAGARPAARGAGAATAGHAARGRGTRADRVAAAVNGLDLSGSDDDPDDSSYGYLGDLHRMPLERAEPPPTCAGLLDDPTYADVTFVCGGQRLHAHRVILATQSEYFHKMFQFGSDGRFGPGGAAARAVVGGSAGGHQGLPSIPNQAAGARPAGPGSRPRAGEGGGPGGGGEPSGAAAGPAADEVQARSGEDASPRAAAGGGPRGNSQIRGGADPGGAGGAEPRDASSAAGRRTFHVEDMRPAVLRAVLSHFYGALDLEDPSLGEIAVDLLVAADRYMMLDLKARCVNAIAASLDCENVLSVLSIAEKHANEALTRSCHDFIAENFKLVVEAPNFLELCTTRPQLVQELCRRSADRAGSGGGARTARSGRELDDGGRAPKRRRTSHK
jgi:hypothetical protein